MVTEDKVGLILHKKQIFQTLSNWNDMFLEKKLTLFKVCLYLISIVW